MATPKPWQDWVYLGIIVAQLAGMLCKGTHFVIHSASLTDRYIVLDFVIFYPKHLHEKPSSPLYFLTSLRKLYTHHSGDPYAASPTSFPFFEAMTYIELASQFPLALYLTPRLWKTEGTDGRTELAALVFACVTATTTAICCFDLWHMTEAVLSKNVKVMLLTTEFGPYAVIRKFARTGQILLC